MLDKIIEFSIKNKLVIGILTLALVGWGLYSAIKLPIDAVPDITDNQVMVITVSPTLAAQEIERLVTFPVEQSMVSIPNISDMRSFSRFGLSIVTIVFEEEVDLYWARQQVQERLSLVQGEIPESIGKPEMAPITTGLGEIYQYTLYPEPGYEDKYDVAELRTIQDWIVKRQLLGTPGVAEVSGFGGYVKQYEIAVDPDKMAGLGIGFGDIFEVLERNNQNTGGAYIDKNPKAYFIRGEGLVNSLEDLEKIVVKMDGDGLPVMIRDVAEARYGNAIRYGAATRNGEGEVVTGIVMMLKGANSSEVISGVKEKIEQIKESLPEGVGIRPFLDRKKLVDNAIGTVSKNLAEGALIVIFVLIFFLGNYRAGLVVASVIPLALLFAFAMMNLFGVSANLMSLGAIDFGLVVDGAVIIVESVMHGISTSGKRHKGVAILNREQMDGEVFSATKKIRSSAAFGEIIILIVYLPLWALVGVEGKMFKPMAQTVSFAILGAFILSLTYVPMMSALALSRKAEHKPNFSDRMMDFFQRIYRLVIEKAIVRKKTVIGIAVGLFVVSVIAFNNMGGEFIPQLDEGDFAVEMRVPTGSSMQQAIETSTKAQRIILSQFPEVDQVVNKIGSGEIPTDPMPIEAGDMMVILKPKDEWTSAETREELIEKMQASLSVLPNATFSFQQPIQMRFNELLTGAKQDVVIKIYGEDLDELARLAKEVGSKIKSVDGVEDLYVEEITGLPQINIELDRDKIATYGMSVEDVNWTVAMAFAGQSAGKVYEGERRFDLMVRLNETARADIADVRHLFVKSPAGEQIPLSELAAVTYKSGPIQIQRDQAKRRITIGFNVRSRDVESIVGDIKQIIGTKMEMPAGYYVTYGGQFKNLQEATNRLAVVVPVALLMIFVLLYFTFGSIKQSVLIFSAIPMSAIGGIFALIIRDLPFSISASVGFIALFGVAVLNGIVLIGEFNRLAKEGYDDICERVLKGTQVRLRPVLMTAMVASLGFFPMAISGSAGAEVQRPLATVVIGGLFTATLLTLIVLPALYIYFTEGSEKKKTPKAVAVAGMLAFLALFSSPAMAQNAPRTVNLNQAIEETLKNNGKVKEANLRTDLEREGLKGAINLSKTDVEYNYGNINNPDINDNAISVSQRLEFPTVYGSRRKLAKKRIEASERLAAMTANELIAEVKRAYLRGVYLSDKRRLLLRQDSVFASLAKSSDLRYKTGESTKLESVTSAVQARQLRNRLDRNTADLEIALTELQVLLQTEDPLFLADSQMRREDLDIPEGEGALAANPLLQYLEQEKEVSSQQVKTKRQDYMPEITFGYSSQTFKDTPNSGGGTYSSGDRFGTYQVGLAIPLFPGGRSAKVRSAKVKERMAENSLATARQSMEGELKALAQEYGKQRNTVDYYQEEALPQADLILDQSAKAFAGGDISYTQHLQNLNLALEIQSAYLDELFAYNRSVIDVEKLVGKK
ncbi:acriflavine resistance protein B (plasmid) [Fulvitalea axinellae]|uniref:Acriflavine resistance protein B n=1 Tax=Fulvitalea axinellae TaxID=1182444 RepID=A0AAU9DA08_9BACT|nr:acriflavine resistance protein B [Fulvitalea axinellae]